MSVHNIVTSPTSREIDAPKCAKCKDVGRQVTTEPPKHLKGKKVRAEYMGFSSSLCECRENLPARSGKASWWVSELIHSESVTLLPFDYTVEISVTAEVPVSEDNYRVQNYGNRYYPTMVSVGEKTLMVEAARELAAALNRAAGKAEAQDIPDQAPCGHWAPCDCRNSGLTVGEGE